LPAWRAQWIQQGTQVVVIQFVHQRQQAAHASVATASAPPGAAHFAQPGQAGLGAAALPRSGQLLDPGQLACLPPVVGIYWPMAQAESSIRTAA